MSAHPEIGPRQTVDRAKHPTLGEGRLVHRNGPAFFVADSGEWCPLTGVDWSGNTARQDGRTIGLDTAGRESGDRHSRAYVHTLGTGWLVALGNQSWCHRFEPDAGSPVEFKPNLLWVGLPEHKDAKSQKAYASQDEANDAGWRCMSDGIYTLVWCHEADKEKALHYLEHRNDPRPAKPKGKRGKMPTGPLPDFTNMTREQLDQWKAAGER